MSYNYQIKVTPRGRNILIVRGLVLLDSIDAIKTEDFDAIYIEDYGQSHSELAYQLQSMSSISGMKSHLKPRFLAATLKSRVHQLKPLVDGFAATPDDEKMGERIEEIWNRLALIDLFDISEVKTNNYVYFLKLCKHAISRGQYTFTTSLEEAYAQGHTALFVAKQDSMMSNMKAEFVRFNQTLRELGYAERKKFEDRIHVCPYCKGSHLYYMEACPKCDSSRLKEEPVLHHFRCANISPESSYAYDGELRCPKCHQMLRHIGVDYDRPANVYTCQECNHTFLHTRMKVYCASCKKTSRPSELLAQDIYSYEFTTEGLQALSSNDALLAVSKDIWAGYSRFDSFLSQIRLFSYSHDKNEVVLINRFKVEGAEVNRENIMHFVSDLQKRYHYHNLSYSHHYIFMAAKVQSSRMETLKKQMEEEYGELLRIVELRTPGIKLADQDFLCQFEGEKIDDFINRISKNQ